MTGTTNAIAEPTAPDPPAQVTKDQGDPTPTRLNLDVGTFTPDSGGAQALALVLEIDIPGDDDGWLSVSAGLTPQIRAVDTLVAGTEYAFRSAVVSSAGVSAFSDTAIIRTEDATPPGAPQGLIQLTLWSDRTDLRWEPPASTGGSPVTAYEIEVTNGTAGIDPFSRQNVTSETFAFLVEQVSAY